MTTTLIVHIIYVQYLQYLVLSKREFMILLHLTELSEETLQNQISQQIRAKILSGYLPENTCLPSIRALARNYHVSVITVQRSYENLMREGLIHSRSTRGYYVSKLTGKKKKEMAEEQVFEALSKPIKAALEEGLTRDDITHIFGKIMDKYKEKIST